ncbi:MAG: RNA-binding S4 domain-containing protein [Clostridiaceae bacterium]|jgi:ribosomal 50S subunit-recycling heat shock protein|nr:RNA-binding S4 domain-containing protein [Eubacteriales bacterium]NLV47847.1 RNA-binding S4 domain-containing protein [Clostridiaceae bacterium]
MRLDKFLKVSRLIKRRTVANEICSAGRVVLNGRIAKPGSEVNPGDILDIRFGSGHTRVRVLDVRSTVRKEEAAELYEMLTDET